jgi:SRSO17 transposase
MSLLDAQFSRQQMNHFVSKSDWSAASLTRKLTPLFNQMTQAASRTQPKRNAAGKILYTTDYKPTGLIFDESGWAKKGQQSVGVARQYCGRTGKVDNCQIGVFSALSRRHHAVLNNVRLFMGNEWTGQPDRMRKVGVPETIINREHRTKGMLATEMLIESYDAGVQFDFVAGDSVYGGSPDLLQALLERDIDFVLNVGNQRRIWLANPNHRMSNPPNSGQPGRPSTRAYPRKPGISMQQYFQAENPAQWQRIQIRKGTKQWITVRIKRVAIWTRILNKTYQLQLLLTQRSGEGIKCAMTNISPARASLKTIAYIHAQRFFVEQAFRDAKQTLGMAEYQIRKWTAWHHHMALVLLAQLLYALFLQTLQGEKLAGTTVYDLRFLYLHFGFLWIRYMPFIAVSTLLKRVHTRRKAYFDSR